MHKLMQDIYHKQYDLFPYFAVWCKHEDSKRSHVRHIMDEVREHAKKHAHCSQNPRNVQLPGAKRLVL